MGRLIIDGNSVYEVDEECIRQKEQQKKGAKEQQEQDRSLKKDHQAKDSAEIRYG